MTRCTFILLLASVCLWIQLSTFATTAATAASAARSLPTSSTGGYFYSDSLSGTPMASSIKRSDAYYRHDDTHGIWYFYDAVPQIDYVYDLESGNKYAISLGRHDKIYELRFEQFVSIDMPSGDMGKRFELHLAEHKPEFQRLTNAARSLAQGSPPSRSSLSFLTGSSPPPSPGLLGQLGHSMSNLAQSMIPTSPDTELLQLIDRHQDDIDAGMATTLMNYLNCLIGRTHPADAHYMRKGILPCVKPLLRPKGPRVLPQSAQKYDAMKARARADLLAALDVCNYRLAANIIDALKKAQSQARSDMQRLQLSVDSQMKVQREKVFGPELQRLEAELRKAQTDLETAKREFEQAVAPDQSTSSSVLHHLVERIRRKNQLVQDLKGKKKSLKLREQQMEQRLQHEAGLEPRAAVRASQSMNVDPFESSALEMDPSHLPYMDHDRGVVSMPRGKSGLQSPPLPPSHPSSHPLLALSHSPHSPPTLSPLHPPSPSHSLEHSSLHSASDLQSHPHSHSHSHSHSHMHDSDPHSHPHMHHSHSSSDSATSDFDSYAKHVVADAENLLSRL